MKRAMKVLGVHVGCLGSPCRCLTAQELAWEGSYVLSVERDVSEARLVVRVAVEAVCVVYSLLGVGSQALDSLFSTAILTGHRYLE